MTMATEQSSAIGRRRLRLELRRARDAANLTQEQVSNEMDWSLSKLNRIESGAVSVSTNDLKALLRLYRIDDPDRVKELTELARASRHAPPWWSEYRDILSEPYRKYIEYEHAASVLRYFHPLLVPGLLQTERYARAVTEMGPGEFAPEDVARYVKIRLRRQRELTAGGRREMTTLLGEGAVRQVVGSSEVMREQLRRLIDADHLGGPVRIVPFDSGAHPGLTGGFAVLEFADPVDPDVLYVDSAPRMVIERDDPDVVESYLRAFGQLEDLALGPQQSASLLRKLLDELP